jgi:HlyD family secretion protein
MDIQRPDRAREIRRRRWIYASIATVVTLLVTLGIARLKPASPAVQKANVWIGQVERGPLVRQVRGSGTLVPVEVNWIPAATDARIARVLVQAGTEVQADTIILELADPAQVQREADTKFQVVAAEADYASLRNRLESDHLDEEASAAQLKAEYDQAKLHADADEEMAHRGILPEITRRLSRNAADELGKRFELQTQRLSINRSAMDTQLAAQKAKVDQLRAQYQLQRDQLSALHVRAGIAGVLQQVNAEVGQRVAAGAILAKVVQPGRLKAALKIAETQAKDIQLGQKAAIDTRAGVVAGHVVRIDPAAENGTVTVDVAIDGALPKGARPDLTVDGTVELERLPDVLYVQRPVHASEEEAGTVFRVDASQKTARRVNVKFGRSSVSAIEVVQGLEKGDRIILSDLSQWDDYDTLRLE